MVFFDAAEISGIVQGLLPEIGISPDLTVAVEIDETTPMGHAQLSSVDPIVLRLESGALEDPKRPRCLDHDGAIDVLGRLLFEVRDRLDPTFGDPPTDDDLSLAESCAWQTYCVARLGRLGHHVQRQRRLYQFRNRHGFTDAADEAFDRLWTANDLTWADVVGISEGARAVLSA